MHPSTFDVAQNVSNVINLSFFVNTIFFPNSIKSYLFLELSFCQSRTRMSIFSWDDIDIPESASIPQDEIDIPENASIPQDEIDIMRYEHRKKDRWPLALCNKSDHRR